MSDLIAADQLKSIVDRVERLEAEIADLNADKSDVYKEARSNGFDVKAIKKVVQKRKLDSSEREEQDAVFDMYWDAVHGSGLVHAHTREIIEEFDPISGEILDATPLRSATPLAVDTVPAASRPEEIAAPNRNDDKPDVAPSDVDLDIGSAMARTEASAVTAGETAPIPEPSVAGGDHVDPQAQITAPAGPLVSISPATKPHQPLRPHCRKPDDCGGYGSTHCGTCLRLASKSEVEA